MRGQYDGIAGFDDLIDFFARLPCPDKQFAVMPGIAHSSFDGGIAHEGSRITKYCSSRTNTQPAVDRFKAMEDERETQRVSRKTERLSARTLFD